MNWFTNKTKESIYTEEDCYVVGIYDVVYEGKLRRTKSGKVVVGNGCGRWFEANPDGTTKAPDGEIKGWFQ